MKNKNKNSLIKHIFIGFNILITLFLVNGILPDKVSATSANLLSPKEVPVYTYHTHPPFIIKTGQGLSYDLAAYLSDKSRGRFQFTVKPMSRLRVNKMLTESNTGIIPWVNPSWFQDKQEKKYQWAKASLMEDGNSVISHQKNKVFYEGPSSLDDLTFGGVRGHVYAGIDDHSETTGNIHRVNAGKHIDNFRKLIKRRIDVTIIPRSGAEYLIQQEGFQDQLFISPKLHSQYRRRVLILNEQAEIRNYINTLLEQMATDPQWLTILHSYQ